MNLEAMMQSVPGVDNWLTNVEPHTRQLLTGLTGSAKTLMLATIFKNKNKSMLIVTDNLFHATQLNEDLTNFIDEENVLTFPVEELLAAELATSSPEFKSERVQTLQSLLSETPKIVVTSISGLRRFLAPVTTWKQATLNLTIGKDIDLKETETQLFTMGYQRQKLVERPGDFAVRGSILDIYPLTVENPIRLDLFDTEIDSLRYFDVTNQRSLENVDQIQVMPATDFIATDEMLLEASKTLKKAYGVEYKRLDSDDQERLESNIMPIMSDFEKGHLSPEHLLFGDIIYQSKTSLLNYLGEDGLVILDDYPRLLESEKTLKLDEDNWMADKLKTHQVLSTSKFGFELRDLLKNEAHAELFLAHFQKGMGNLKFNQLIDVPGHAMQQFFSQIPLLKTEMDRWLKKKQTIIVMVQDKERLNKVSQTLDDFEIPSIMTTLDSLQLGKVQVVEGNLQAGFELPTANLVVVTEHEMFNKVTKKRPKRQTLANAERLKSYQDLKPGDYVVHVNHGIGQFMGMETLEVDGKHQDYMTIAYRDEAKLFIPVTQLNMVQKYVSSESKSPRINKLGGTEWTKTKNKVAAKIEDIADDLVALYAEREAEVGFTFSKDNDYQMEFENAFPYSETEDQIRSSNEIKHDMEQKKPMDRLLIGDVGFGKTEVALRAAFKAIQDHKQVALLVPTTVLAQQHYETMINRFEGFPVEIGILSRFRTKKQLKETTEKMASGALDIVVGTHRILSKDIQFADLGLLIVDEEQRFGVKHKERLKEFKSQVDVLTLTATPIPRTLNMSMLGVRDLSVIETAPLNRYPIQTYVMEQNGGTIRDGIQRELQRGGQVFYLHNRVEDIEKVVSEIEIMVPEASVAYIHGQMTENQLENVLYDFIQGVYDVLVTTTIIETGVDISNANTLFVENADHMGLAQLYQLRGRVGRSSRIAYSYFMYKPNKVLTEVSEKRLEAIKDFTELGSGFKIAMRDLSIRGAGNLLGRQQHGFIDSVGYDLYTQMLTEAVNKKQGKKVDPKSDSEIEINIEAYLPSTYIDDQRQKIEIYKRIRQLDTYDQYLEVQGDLIDRFGEFPTEVNNLMEVGLLKLFADKALVEKIKKDKDQLIVSVSEKGTTLLGTEAIFKALSTTKLKASLKPQGKQMRVILVIQPKMTEEDWLIELQNVVQALSESVGEITIAD
ncbi:transcription-repair coupling factor [Dellaglioa carnosa]|uniref:Transcription-repair-coupling factor n=1 Tax=Dellaglioa carnosa TaxID=2995136 RepID=A0ABT4JNS7_9LACO|nr:transcription-repair coupling factor [Dellaglioa carnosa]MCZ2492002.1 transcription-repair coupling factor [Dellaglioa carnosa]MCZ2495039.1 transcription-repair coupling factor [Dellaglioa carnosa]MDK1731849.1 transcription-repair coupling factor [Dellaglioa carnosa]